MRSMVLYTNVMVILFQTSLTTCCVLTGTEINLDGNFSSSVNVLSKSLLSSCLRDALSIRLSSNHFTTVNVDAFDGFYALETIILTNNSITELPVGLFDRSFKNSLKHVFADQNEITALNNDLFKNNRYLETVQVAENKINFIDTNVLHEGLTKLQEFNVSHNKLIYFEPWPYKPKTPQDDNIKLIFDASHNLIERITNNMNWTYDLIQDYEYETHLQFNNISIFSNDLLFQFRENSDDLSILTELLTYNINMTNNPFFCDCNAYDIVNDLHTSFFLYYRVEQFRYRCDAPSHLQGIDFFHDLDFDQFVCNVTDGCPSDCACQEQPYISTLVINCTNGNHKTLPKTIPKMSHNIQYVSLYMGGNQITSISMTHYSSVIKNLTLANNELNYINGDILKEMGNLDKFDISGNALKYLPKEIQKQSFDTVSIKNNPFVCDCNMTWMSDWITLSGNTDELHVQCTFNDETRVIKDVTLDNIDCNMNTDIYYIIGAIVAVSVLLGFGLVTAKRCPYETKVLIYRYFGIHRNPYLVDQAETMHYDAYLSFDENDIQVRQWIKTIFLPKMEERGKKKYAFFCPERDALGGDDYGQDLVNKMTRSRRIFVLLSPEYFKNTWRNFESDQAEIEHNASEDSHSRVVYIIWNDKNQDIIDNLKEEPWKSRLIGKRVLSPDERFFWSKVRYELPIKPRNKLNRVNNSFTNLRNEHETNEKKTVFTIENARPVTPHSRSCNDLTLVTLT